MVFQCFDPSPFIRENLWYEDIPNCEFMVRVVALGRPPARNENLAIITISPLPSNPLQFAAVRGVIRDFFASREEVYFPGHSVYQSRAGFGTSHSHL
jgi:hypothetical protein